MTGPTSEGTVGDGMKRADFTPLAREYLDSLLRGERDLAVRRILDAVEGGTPIQSVYLDVFQPVQREIGRLWQENLITVAHEHYCTAVTQLCMARLYPRIFSTRKKGRRIVAACVGGELHEIGIRMVADFFEMEGWDSYYLGANMPTPGIVRCLGEQGADILAISVSMATHVAGAAELVSEVRESGAKAKIIVGGLQFLLSPDLWIRVGADGFAPDAEAALGVADRLLVARGGDHG